MNIYKVIKINFIGGTYKNKVALCIT